MVYKYGKSKWMVWLQGTTEFTSSHDVLASLFLSTTWPLLSCLLVSFSSTFAPGGSKTLGSTGLLSSQYRGKIFYLFVHVTCIDHSDWLSKRQEHERPSAWPWGKRSEASWCQLEGKGDNPWRAKMLNWSKLTGVYFSVHLKACKTGRARTETYFLNGRPVLFRILHMN